jgi:hypothetical protein
MARTVTQREDDGFWEVSGQPAGTYYDHQTAMRLARELDAEDDVPTSPASEQAQEDSVTASILMLIALAQGGSILVPNANVSVGVPASPAGVQRRAAFVLPVTTDTARTITLLTENAEVGSQLWLVLPDRLATGGSYRLVTEVVESDPVQLITGAAFAALVGYAGPFTQMFRLTFNGTQWGALNGSGAGGQRLIDVGITSGT